MEQENRTIYYDNDLKVEAYHFKGIMQKFPNHFHEYYVIGFIESGQRQLSCKNKEYIVGEGDLLLFNPMDNHTCQQIDNRALDYRCINIKSEIMKKAALEVTGENYIVQFTQPVAFCSEQVSLLRDLHKIIMENQKDFQKEQIFFFLIKQLIQEYSEPLCKREEKTIQVEIQTVCEYLESNYSKRISLDDLSYISGVNKYYLLRSFTRHKGITPYRYMEAIRINHAKRLLEKGVEIIDAAMQTGFADQSHFTNFFKGFIGITPKQYQSIFMENDK